MILGLSVGAFTALHVIVSLVGIAAGLVVVWAMLANRRADTWTAVFLATTVLTSVTGFFFHSKAIGPPHVVGVISLAILAAVLVALYGRHLVGAWRPVYIVGAVAALYLNCFVGVVQAFQKLSFLRPLAPTGSEPPFLVAQAATLVLFGLLGVAALQRYRPAAAPQAAVA
jgi:hypothetical protein